MHSGVPGERQTQLSLGIRRGLIPGPLWIPKSEDTPILYVKWHGICI